MPALFNAGNTIANSEVLTRPVEVDLADPATMEEGHWRCSDTDVFLRLEEMYPGDPGQLSGACLKICDSGAYATFRAEIGTHCLGYLDDESLAEFIAALSVPRPEFQIGLSELYPQVQPLRPSGATLLCTDDQGFYADPKVGLYFGNHCLGVVRGELLDVFLKCLTYRCAVATN